MNILKLPIGVLAWWLFICMMAPKWAWVLTGVSLLAIFLYGLCVEIYYKIRFNKLCKDNPKDLVKWYMDYRRKNPISSLFFGIRKD